MATKTLTLPLELHLEGEGNIARYSAEGAKTNTKALVALRKDALGAVPPTIEMTLTFEVDEPVDPDKLAEVAAQVAADAAPPSLSGETPPGGTPAEDPKPKTTRPPRAARGRKATAA